MKQLILLTGFLLTVGVAFGQKESEKTPPTSKMEMLIPGVFQPGQPKVQSGEVCWGLYVTEDGTYESMKTTVTVDSVPDAYSQTEVPNLRTDVDKDFLFLVCGSTSFEPGPVKTDYACKYKALPPQTQVDIADFGKGCYRISSRGDTVGDNSVLNYSVTINAPGKQGARDQTLLSLDRTCMGCEETPTLLWVGDIDRDGRPDIFLDSDPYPGRLLMLFLSSEAQEGKIVHKGAELQIMGC